MAILEILEKIWGKVYRFFRIRGTKSNDAPRMYFNTSVIMIYEIVLVNANLGFCTHATSHNASPYKGNLRKLSHY